MNGSLEMLKQSDETKRINFNLSAHAFNELKKRSEESGASMTEILRWALGLVSVVMDETKLNHKIVVTTSDGRPIKELVLPRA